MGSSRALHSSTPAELKARIEAERAGLPFLVYRDGDGAQQIFAFGAAERVTVGRNEANDIAVAWDGETSRLHSELVRMGAEWTIADDGLSRNGTYVNGVRISGRPRLRDGDAIRFGATEAVFRAPAPATLEETSLPAGAPVPTLTPAQRRVLLALARPFGGETEHAVAASNRQIAEELVVSVDAVKANLRALFEKFAVEDLPQNHKRARLVELALGSGVISRRDLDKTTP